MKNLLELTKKIVARNDEKGEINFAYIHDDILVATDTRRMLIIKGVDPVKEPLLLDVYSGVPWSKDMGYVGRIEKTFGKYPDYKKIIIKEAKIKKAICEKEVHKDSINYVICEIARLGATFNVKYIQDLISHKKVKIDYVSIDYNENNLPFQLKGIMRDVEDGKTYNFTYIVMPIVY